MNRYICRLIILISLSSLSVIVSAYQSTESSKLIQPSSPIERIEVYGQKPLRYYLKQYRRRESEFFKAFNQLIDEPDMKIRCTRRQVSFTKFRPSVCQPLFVGLIVSEEKQNAIKRGGSLSSAAREVGRHEALEAVVNRAHVDARIKSKNDELAVKMAELVNSNPELLKKFNELQEAKFNVDAKKSHR